MTKETDMRDADLDDLFAEARATEPEQNASLMARVCADGLRLQPQPQPAPSVRPVLAGKTGWWASLANALGGKRGLAGLGTVAVAGVVLGLVQPTSVLALTEPFFAAATVDEVDLMPGIDAILTEG